jgi:hypothetical protein
VLMGNQVQNKWEINQSMWDGFSGTDEPKTFEQFEMITERATWDHGPYNVSGLAPTTASSPVDCASRSVYLVAWCERQPEGQSAQIGRSE